MVPCEAVRCMVVDPVSDPARCTFVNNDGRCGNPFFVAQAAVVCVRWGNHRSCTDSSGAVIEGQEAIVVFVSDARVGELQELAQTLGARVGMKRPPGCGC